MKKEVPYILVLTAPPCGHFILFGVYGAVVHKKQMPEYIELPALHSSFILKHRLKSSQIQCTS